MSNALELRKKLLDPKVIGALLAVVGAVGILGFVIARHTVLAETSAGEASRLRVVIDSETGKVYEKFKIKEGLTIPFVNPDTGKNTLFPAESCFWTKDGKAKVEPTYVLLNEVVGKPGPTLCPDCGRKVTFHNPQPPNELMIKAFEAAAKK